MRTTGHAAAGRAACAAAAAALLLGGCTPPGPPSGTGSPTPRPGSSVPGSTAPATDSGSGGTSTGGPATSGADRTPLGDLLPATALPALEPAVLESAARALADASAGGRVALEQDLERGPSLGDLPAGASVEPALCSVFVDETPRELLEDADVVRVRFPVAGATGEHAVELASYADVADLAARKDRVERALPACGRFTVGVPGTAVATSVEAVDPDAGALERADAVWGTATTATASGRDSTSVSVSVRSGRVLATATLPAGDRPGDAIDDALRSAAEALAAAGSAHGQPASDTPSAG